jgi:hypothetical protein
MIYIIQSKTNILGEKSLVPLDPFPWAYLSTQDFTAEQTARITETAY